MMRNKDREAEQDYWDIHPEEYLQKHPEILNFWLGDAANKQSRINLYYECKDDQKLLESVLNHWKWNK
jgi:spore coat polysaccharide biosynthesis protein SpsF (cytidylyltransferase family)